jgi:ABC-type transport system involved in cytochrome c biogenesis permease subunit
MKKILPLSVLILGVVYLALALFPPAPKGDFDLVGFGRLPVLLNGRLKPMDTVARTTLLVLQGRQNVTAPGGRVLSPNEWLLDALFRPKEADGYQVFEIVHPDVLALFGFTTADGAGGKRFSFAQLEPKLNELERQASLARQTEPPERNAFQRAVLTLRDHVMLYDRLTISLIRADSPDFLDDITKFQAGVPAGVAALHAKQDNKPYDEAAAKATFDAAERFTMMADNGYILAIPPLADDTDATHWRNAGTALLDGIKTGALDPAVVAYAGLSRAWIAQNPTEFNTIVRLYRPALMGRFANRITKTDAEARFNAAQPFYHGMILYVGAFLLAVFSWLKWPDALGRAAFWLVGLAWALTTVGILTRMWLEGRPPVTNLYSSALFVGWGAVALCLVLEKIFHNAIGSVAGGLVGFCTLLIAHYLSFSGDTLEMMQAVLDSNFWLATHVVMVTTGYAATFLAGFLALIYVIRGVFTATLDKATADALAKMVYGIVCFATLFSFVGTVLGGIWADQSWGRFWGWDPKENGALIIVLWNALILHARWGGLVKRRGLMALALFGNIVTSWSWFGVNMLGVGLHSYGFTDAAFLGLIAFVASQLGLIALILTPGVKWRRGVIFCLQRKDAKARRSEIKTGKLIQKPRSHEIRPISAHGFLASELNSCSASLLLCALALKMPPVPRA